MADIVAQLKSTPKGQLQYGGIINEDYLLNSLKKLCISPSTLKTFPKVTEDEFNATILEKKPVPYSNYYTPQPVKRVSKSPQKDKSSCSNARVKEFSSVKKMIDEVEPVNDHMNNNNNNTNNNNNNNNHHNNNNEIVLQNIEQEYRDRSKNVWNARTQDYHTNILQFDLDHANSVKTMERVFIMKQNKEMNQLIEDQNRSSDELAHYHEMKKMRDSVASERVRQNDLQSREIVMKIKKDNALKEEKVAKKRTLANFVEPGLKVLNLVTQLFVENEKEKKCDEFKSFVNKVNEEYAELTNIVNQGLYGNFNLDVKIQEAREKLNHLNASSKNCEDLSKQIEMKLKNEQKAKENAERKAKEDFENIAKEEEKRAKQAVVAVAPTPATTSAIPPLENDLNIATSAPALIPIESMLKPMLQMFVPKLMFREYLKSSKLLSDTEKLYESLNKPTTKEGKSYKFDLYKVINTTINAISDESPRHLVDKITRLITLLSAKEVVNAGKRISTKLDPQALILSKDLVAKKLVLQGPTQVASSHKAAFAIAAVALGIWSQFPDVGELLVAHLYMKCPYVVPFYIPKSKDISTVDYCRLIGYNVDGDEVESEDKYLKKLSGVIRLYAAIISSEVPPSFGNGNHPHGLDHGWSWLTRVLNLQPRPVTATIIFDFLEVAGHAMMKRFGKQFRKLLLALCQDVMPKILEVTPKESKAGAMRLQIFLERCIKEGRVKEPEGYLTKQWYNNSSYYR